MLKKNKSMCVYLGAGSQASSKEKKNYMEHGPLVICVGHYLDYVVEVGRPSTLGSTIP